MTATGTCPQCGTLLFSETAAGLCPKCLGALGFAGAAGEATSPATPPPLPRIGDYELIEEIARGGMGVVYKARQLSLGRIVAVKVVLHGPFSSPEFVRRFQTEATAVAALQHPHIVAIYEVGEQAGDHFFSMEFIEGQSLAETVREKPLPARRAATYLKTIAEAVHYAHQRGVLHRDLKPSNVLLDIFDQPRITDFGLAKLQDGEVELTRTGQVLGSPSYISPEQAAGKNSAAGPEGDIYSLGTILYHLLTGRPPFQGETIQEVLLQVQNAEPVAPRRLNASVPVDLQTICLKCLRKEPAKRYVSALELAEDLVRFLANEPIRARPIGVIGRLARWCRRKPALAVSLGVGVALLLFVAIGSPIAAIYIERERQAAEVAGRQEAVSRVRAESAERATQQQLFTALVEQARATVRSGQMGRRVRALDALSRAGAISNTVELRREVFPALELSDLRFKRELSWGAEYTLRKMDPSFERVALCRGGGPVEIRSTVDQRLLATLPASSKLPAYDNSEWSADGKYLAVKRDRTEGGGRADWEVWDVTDARRVLLLHDIPLAAVGFHPHLPRLVAGRPAGEVEVWDLGLSNVVTRFQLGGTPQHLRYSPEGDRIAAAYPQGDDWVLSTHATTHGSMLASQRFSSRVKFFAWHPGGRWLAVPTHDSSVQAMDAQSGETQVIGQHTAEAVTVVFSPGGDYLVSGGWDEELICWDAAALRREFTISLASFYLQFSQDGSQCSVLTASGLKLYAFERPSCYREFGEDLGARLRRGSFSPDGRWLAASAEKRLGLWDLANVGPGALMDDGHDSQPCFSPGGAELFASRINGTTAAFRWKVTAANAAGAPPQVKSLPLHQPDGFAFLSLFSNCVAMTGTSGSQLLTPEQVDIGPKRWLPTVAGPNEVSPDGRWLAIYQPYGQSLLVYQLPGLERVVELPHLSSIAEFRFSPRGDEVAIGSRSGIVFWSTQSWERTRTLTNFAHVLYPVDGRTLWLGKYFHLGGLYDRRTLEPLLLLPDDKSVLAVSPDGSRVAICADGRRLQVWDLTELRLKLRELGLDWPDPSNQR